MENLKYVKSVTFYDEKRGRLGSLFSDGWEVTYSKKYLEWYLEMLSYFNPDLLEDLVIDRGGQIVSHACQVFPKLKKIYLRRMIGCHAIENEFPAQISELSQLQYLTEFQWDYMEIPARYQQVLFSSGCLQQLKVLVIPSVEYPIQLPRLEQLKLKCIFGLDNCISNISTVTSTLRNLDLSHTSITDIGIQALPKLPCLEFLSIGTTHITDIGMELISSIETLKFLDIERISTDQGIFHLQKLTKLKGLVMSSYIKECSDAVVPYLMKMTSLVYLDMTCWKAHQYYGSDLLSVSAVKKLRSHPSLKRLATYYKMETFGGSCGRIQFVKSKHATYDVMRNNGPEKIESRFLDPDGWRISALEKLIE